VTHSKRQKVNVLAVVFRLIKFSAFGTSARRHPARLSFERFQEQSAASQRRFAF
jgi:hypothetical protein